jgi:hypothetical protein
MTKPVLPVVLSLLTLAAPPHAQQPTADALREAGHSYLASYLPRLSGTLLDERYLILEVAGGRMQMPNRLGSDIILLNFNGTAMAVRDAYAISGAKIREAAPRLPELLAEVTQARWDQALAYDRDSQLHFMAETVMRLNDPMIVLRFMSPADPSKFKYSVEGKKKLNGIETVGLRFDEIRGDGIKYALDTRGNASVSGRFWMDPATGAIHQTDFSADSKTEVARVTVVYAPDTRLNLLLPSKTVESYEERPLPGGPRDMGKGAGSSRGGFQRFEATATYSNPRHSPIDLSKARD